MTTLNNRPNTGLLIVDVQNGVMGNAHEREATIATIATLVDKARAADIDVVWVQDTGGDRTPGSDPWQIVPELGPLDSEPVVQKGYGDAFEDTDLEDVLGSRGVGRLFVAGAQTDACIRSTLHGAFTRGYDTTLVSDAHTTADLSEYGAPTPDKVIDHTNLYWEYQRAPGRTAGTVTTADVDFDSVQAGAT